MNIYSNRFLTWLEWHRDYLPEWVWESLAIALEAEEAVWIMHNINEEKRI